MFPHDEDYESYLIMREKHILLGQYWRFINISNYVYFVQLWHPTNKITFLTLLVLALHTVRMREVRAWFCENC